MIEEIEDKMRSRISLKWKGREGGKIGKKIKVEIVLGIMEKIEIIGVREGNSSNEKGGRKRKRCVGCEFIRWNNIEERKKRMIGGNEINILNIEKGKKLS